MKRYLIIMIAALALAGCCGKGAGRKVAKPANDYIAASYIYGDGDTLRYQFLEPVKVGAKAKYPLVLFLHGAGERGEANLRQMIHCSRVFTNPANRIEYPAYVLFPQCPSDAFWAYSNRGGFTLDNMPAENPETPVMAAVKGLLDTFLATHDDIDPNRLYIMGLSMGAMATFDMVTRYPDLFAAAVPMCGAINPSRLTAAIKTPFRIFHGDADPVVPLKCSRDAFWALYEAGVPVEIVEFPGVGHNVWDPAITRDDFLPWVFSHKK